MPISPRRRLTRSIPPRPTYEGAPGAEVASTNLRPNAEARRVADNTLRHAPYLQAELKRIAGITVVCLGMLGVLAAIDQFR